MKLICPSCGAVHSAEAWMSDADARQCLRIVGALPWDVSRRALAYLALFRPGQGGLRWSKALRLMADLQEKIEHPHIQWDNKPARPNNPLAWGRAMERVIEAPPKRLPLRSHGYLQAVAYEIADEMDRAEEFRGRKSEVGGRKSGGRGQRSEPERFSMNPEELRRIRKNKGGNP